MVDVGLEGLMLLQSPGVLLVMIRISIRPTFCETFSIFKVRKNISTTRGIFLPEQEIVDVAADLNKLQQ